MAFETRMHAFCLVSSVLVSETRSEYAMGTHRDRRCQEQNERRSSVVLTVLTILTVLTKAKFENMSNHVTYLLYSKFNSMKQCASES